MRWLNTLLFVTILFHISLGYAEEEHNNLFKLTFVNHTNTTFFYTHVTGSYPSTVFDMIPTALLPGKEIVLLTTSSNKTDLVGELHFKNNDAVDNIFTLINYRKFHTGQAIFSMKNDRYFSVIQSKQISKSLDPLSLLYDNATVIINNN